MKKTQSCLDGRNLASLSQYLNLQPSDRAHLLEIPSQIRVVNAIKIHRLN